MIQKKTNIFIAGAGGYLGTKLTQYLLNKGYKVIALDRFFFGNTLEHLKNDKNLKIIKDDIRYFEKKNLKGVDVVINLASLSNDPSADLNIKFTKQINYLGAKRLANIARQMRVKKYIFASSCSVYGFGENILDETSPLSPVSEYAKSKINAEKALIKTADKEFGVIIYRLATLFGVSEKRMRFDLMVNIMTLHAWQNNKVFILGGGAQWRPLLHIDEAIRAFEIGIKHELQDKYEIFNIGSNENNFQTIQVANELKKYFPSLDIEITPDDPDPRNYRVSFNKATKQLRFKTKKTLHEGIAEVKDALEKGLIKDGIETSTHKYYQYLMEANDILGFVKLKKKLF